MIMRAGVQERKRKIKKRSKDEVEEKKKENNEGLENGEEENVGK